MDKDLLKKVSEVYPLKVRHYEQYIDDTDNTSSIEKINAMIQNLHQIGRLTNDVVENWNMVMKWLVSNGIEDITEDYLRVKLDVALNTGLRDLTELVVEDEIAELMKSEQFEVIVESAINNMHENIQGSLNEFAVQLAETGEEVYKTGKAVYQINKAGTATYRKRKPTFTIQDDDTQNELYSKLYPIAVEYNIPISAALISSRVGKVSSTITMAQFYEMRDSGLVEFCNHTHNHSNLTSLTLEQVDDEIRLCEEFLERHGCGGTKHLVYPFGGQNGDVARIASKYVHSASRSNNHIVDPAGATVSSFALNRIVMEADMELIKSKIDEAVQKNAWIILNVHAHYPEFSEAKLREVIDYALSAGMTFDNFSNPYREFSNVLEVRDYTDSSTSSILGTISASGRTTGIFAKNETDTGSGISIKEIDSTTTLATSPPSYYPSNSISSTRFTKARGESNGWGEAGILFTDNRGGEAYTYQEFHGLGKNTIKKRSWNLGADSWHNFNVLGSSTPVADTNTILVNTTSYTLPAFGRQSVTLTIPGVSAKDSVIINPTSTIPSFFMYTVNASISSDDTVILRLFNFSDVERTIEPSEWRVKWFKNT